MTNKRVKRNRRKTNPLMKVPSRVGRPKLSFDGANISSTTYVAIPVTAANQAKAVFTVDCDSAVVPATTAGAASAVASGVLGIYSEYRYTKLSFEYIPSLGPASTDAGGRIHIAYIDNPEKMAVFQAAAVGAVALGEVRGAKTLKSFNAWERFTYNVPLTWRKKLFDVNTTVVPGNADTYDRSTQGMVIMFIESISAAIVVGSLKIDSTIYLTGLDVNITT